MPVSQDTFINFLMEAKRRIYATQGDQAVVSIMAVLSLDSTSL